MAKYTMDNSSNRLFRKYLKITIVVILYWFVSIMMVFLNKTILNKIKAPFFITWFQCLITCMLLALFRILANLFPGGDKLKTKDSKSDRAVTEIFQKQLMIPKISVRWTVIKRIVPLSAVFVGMIAFNNLSLEYVGVPFYFIVRSLTPVFNVILTRIILHKQTSIKSIACCVGIIFGFFLGVDQEQALGTLSIAGVIFGIMASLFVSLNSIFVADMLIVVENNASLLSYYNSMIAVVLFIPLMIINDELPSVYQSYVIITDTEMSSSQFWFLLFIAGVFGLLISIVTNLQIKYTSPLTHNISGTAKACVQTILATYIYHEQKTIDWWISNAIVLCSSAMYTYVKQQEMKTLIHGTQAKKFTKNDAELTQSLIISNADDEDSDENNSDNNNNKNKNQQQQQQRQHHIAVTIAN